MLILVNYGGPLGGSGNRGSRKRSTRLHSLCSVASRLCLQSALCCCSDARRPSTSAAVYRIRSPLSSRGSLASKPPAPAPPEPAASPPPEPAASSEGEEYSADEEEEEEEELYSEDED